MGHLPKLIEDLALILIVAAFVVLIFRKIKQPLVLGYIIAGFLVSPNFKIFPSVVDMTNIKTLAEIGVIFLLFSLGVGVQFQETDECGRFGLHHCVCRDYFHHYCRILHR